MSHDLTWSELLKMSEEELADVRAKLKQQALGTRNELRLEIADYKFFYQGIFAADRVATYSSPWGAYSVYTGRRELLEGRA